MTLVPADDSFDPLEPDEALDAREYLRVLWHDKWRILGLGILLSVVLGLIGLTVVNPRFRTDATVSMYSSTTARRMAALRSSSMGDHR